MGRGEKIGRNPKTIHPKIPISPASAPPPGRGRRGEKGYLGYLLAAGPGRNAADAGTFAGRSRRHTAAICRAHDAEGRSRAVRRRPGAVGIADPQTVGVIIRNLERDGAIQKTPHPVHGRVLQWTLTRRGEGLLANAGGPSKRWSGG